MLAMVMRCTWHHIVRAVVVPEGCPGWHWTSDRIVKDELRSKASLIITI